MKFKMTILCVPDDTGVFHDHQNPENKNDYVVKLMKIKDIKIIFVFHP